MLNREKTIKHLAGAYFNVLSTLGTSLNDSNIYAGLKEGLNKFLSNLAIKLNGKYTTESADYISCEALAQIKKHDLSELVYEHMVPKEKYIQSVCLNKAMQGTLTYQDVYELLNKYWFIAIITKSENLQLNLAGLRSTMPKNWDGKNIFARYNYTNIHLHFVK
jgi:hypothetical protein